MKQPDYAFCTTCVGSDRDTIRPMIAEEKPIKYATLCRLCGIELRVMEFSIGYVAGREKGLRMRDDPFVHCFRSRYNGHKCVFFRWSGIEHVFVYDPSTKRKE